MELIQRQLIFKRLVGLEKPRPQLACIGIEYADLGVVGGDISMKQCADLILDGIRGVSDWRSLGSPTSRQESHFPQRRVTSI